MFGHQIHVIVGFTLDLDRRKCTVHTQDGFQGVADPTPRGRCVLGRHSSDPPGATPAPKVPEHPKRGAFSARFPAHRQAGASLPPPPGSGRGFFFACLGPRHSSALQGLPPHRVGRNSACSHLFRSKNTTNHRGGGHSLLTPPIQGCDTLSLRFELRPVLWLRGGTHGLLLGVQGRFRILSSLHYVAGGFCHVFGWQP